MLRLRPLLIVLLALLLPLRVAVATAQVPCPFAGMAARVAATPAPGCQHASRGAPAVALSMPGDAGAGTGVAVDRAAPADHAAGHGTQSGHGKPCGACPACASCATCVAGTGAVAFALAAIAQTDRLTAPLQSFGASAEPISSYIGTGLDRPPRPL